MECVLTDRTGLHVKCSGPPACYTTSNALCTHAHSRDPIATSDDITNTPHDIHDLRQHTSTAFLPTARLQLSPARNQCQRGLGRSDSRILPPVIFCEATDHTHPAYRRPSLPAHRSSA